MCRPTRERRAIALIVVVVGAGCLICPLPCPAQVLEIGDDGAVTVFDGPAVVTSEGVTPIATAHPQANRGRLRAGASDERIGEAAAAAQLSPALVEAVAWNESRMNPGVVSRAGAIGEMQLMPATARALGVDPRDTGQNYHGGAVYLRLLLNRYDGDLERALAAYNAGPGAVDRHGGVPPYRETRAYVAAVMERLSQQVASVDSKGAKR